MTALSAPEAIFLGTVLEGICYGVFCVVFALYVNLQHKGPGSSRLLLMYPLGTMFVLCTAFMCLDFTQQFLGIFRPTAPNTGTTAGNINTTTSIIYSLVDIISQSILIYRCWTLWDRNPYFILVPSILALTSFATAITLVAEQIVQDDQKQASPVSFLTLGTASFSISLAVNTIVTGLIVLRLAILHREVTANMPKSRLKKKLWPLISMFIESGMLTFFSQLTWVVLFQLQNTGFNSIGGPVTMIYGITPTLVLVRVAMGRSYEGKATTVVNSGMSFAQSTDPYELAAVNSARAEDKNYTIGGSTTRVNQSADALEKGV